MQDRPDKPSANPLPRLRRAALIDELAQLPAMGDQPLLAQQVVMSVRILVLASRLGRDPLLEITHRIGCLATAKSFIAFADAMGECWPEKVQVLRPCCRVLSPDEATIAQLAVTASRGRREEFCAVLDGFVRSSRHERLYDLATQMAALMH